jgi:hypothetical protein
VSVLISAGLKVVRFKQEKEPNRTQEVVCRSIEVHGKDLYIFFIVNGIKRCNIYTNVIDIVVL